jgi:hypothetical protein
MPWNQPGSHATWDKATKTLMPRFEHVYPSVSNDISVDFEYHVQSEFPWFVASETPVVVESFISSP